MEITREGKIWMIFCDFKKDLSRQECLVSLRETLGNEAPSEKIVYNWFGEFRRGCVRPWMDLVNGGPKSVVIPNNIGAVCKIIEKDRHVTYREIEASLGISETAIRSILHKHLADKKI